MACFLLLLLLSHSLIFFPVNWTLLSGYFTLCNLHFVLSSLLPSHVPSPPSFDLCCRYGALKALGEKKQCFNEFIQQKRNEEKEEERRKAKQVRQFTVLGS